MTAAVNLVTLMDRYNNDQKCRDALERIRWPNGVSCLRCGDTDVDEIESRNQWRCRSCDYRFSVTAGTIMHRSHLPLRKWFLAIYLMCESKKGMSANQLKRTLGVQYRTAWHLCHRIGEAMGNDPFTGPTLVGVVEVDETMVGGKRSGKNWRENKHWVAGAIERGGKVRIERIPNIRKATLHDFIRRTVRDEAEAIYTDDLKSYMGVGDGETRHETVNHSAEEWVVGDVHTNSVEGVWSLFKRSIVGTFHKMSAKHMDRYLEELEWRFNNRDNPHMFRDALRRILNTDPLEYRRLVAQVAAPNWSNRTIWTEDCLYVLRGMNSESVDLIHLDPPFNSDADYAAPIGSRAAGTAFKDTWALPEVDAEWINLMEARHPALYRVLLAAMTDSDKSCLEVDHIIARAKGGTDHAENLQLLCGHCNRTKGDRGMEYLRTKLSLHRS